MAEITYKQVQDCHCTACNAAPVRIGRYRHQRFDIGGVMITLCPNCRRLMAQAFEDIDDSENCCSNCGESGGRHESGCAKDPDGD